MRATINDIAKACEVSKSLVSRIVNDDPLLRCTLSVRKRVLEEVEKQGYVPDGNARMLANKMLKSNRKLRIGYIRYSGSANIGHPYFDKIIEGIESEVVSTGCELAVSFNIQDAHKKFEKGQPLSDSKLDGLLLFGEVVEKDFAEYLREQSRYIVSLYGAFDEDSDFVGSDLYSTISLMLDYIKRLKFTEIGLVIGTDKKRMEKAEDYVKQIGLVIDRNFHLNGQFKTEETYLVMCEALKEFKPPKVICCLNDEMAFGCIKALLQFGYRVPEDVSVTGHDDITKATYFDVPLTTVRIFKEEIGRLSVTILLERMGNKRKFPIKVIVPGKLIKRSSLIGKEC